MIQVMKKHLANQDIIVHACKVLGSLAVNTKNQVTIAKADGIPVRIDSIVHHRKERAYPNLVTLVLPPLSFSLPYP
jgi:hypothetical protein